VKIAREIEPDSSTLVPEKRVELTTEGGLDVVKNKKRVGEVVTILRDAGIKMSLFIDPTLAQVKAAREVGADAIEIHTGLYCEAKTPREAEAELKKVMVAAKEAYEIGLEVKAGHGLNYVNVNSIADIPEIEELSIGHSIVARAVLVGMERAVREMIALIQRPPHTQFRR
jgi:pyridoxine 5-phosphate synthase